jgi:hypothetical protein
LSRQSNILFNIPNNITYKLSEVRRGEEMGQQGKKGGERLESIKEKTKEGNLLYTCTKYVKRKGGPESKEQGNRKGIM